MRKAVQIGMPYSTMYPTAILDEETQRFVLSSAAAHQSTGTANTNSFLKTEGRSHEGGGSKFSHSNKSAQLLMQLQVGESGNHPDGGGHHTSPRNNGNLNDSKFCKRIVGGTGSSHGHSTKHLI